MGSLDFRLKVKMETNLVVIRDEWFYYELNTYVNPCNFAVFEEDDSSFYIEEREV